MDLSAEVVEFRVPLGSDKTVFVWNISAAASSSEEEISNSLWKVFSEFGVLYSVRVYRNASVAEPGYYAVVKFFSSRDAIRAQQACNKQRLFQESPLKLQNISGLDEQENAEVKTLTPASNLKYLCIVEIVLHDHSLCSRGVAVAEERLENYKDPLEFILKTGKIQKYAVQKALSDAFLKIILVVLENGKVAVQHRPAQEDLVDCLSEEDLEGLIKVNDLSWMPYNIDGEEEPFSDFSFHEELEEGM